MKIGIVVNYNNYKQTIICCDNLLKVNIDKIIIVDNFSQNESFKKIKTHFSKFRNVFVLQTDNNIGYARGNNIALEFVENKWGISKDNVIFIVNPDSIVNEKNLLDIESFIYNHKDAGMVTVNLNNTLSNVWHHIQPWRIFIINVWIIRLILFHFGINECGHYKKHKNDEFQKVDVVLGAFFGIDQELFHRIGYFDRKTFLYYEEEILYSKLQKKGFQNYILNTSSFKHLGGGSTDLNEIRLKEISDTSRLYVLRKFYNVGQLYVSLTKTINNIDDFVLSNLNKKSNSK